MWKITGCVSAEAYLWQFPSTGNNFAYKTGCVGGTENRTAFLRHCHKNACPPDPSEWSRLSQRGAVRTTSSPAGTLWGRGWEPAGTVDLALLIELGWFELQLPLRSEPS